MIEITAAPQMAVPLMLGTALAAIVATALASDSLMTERLSRRGLRIHHHAEVDALRNATAGSVMSSPVVTVAADATIAETRVLVADGRHGAYPILDEQGHLQGIVSRTDLLADDLGDDAGVLDLARREVVSAGPEASVLDILETIVRERVEHIPIIENDQLVGICTRTDVLAARARQLEDERVPKKAPS
jgi:CBS domain-containing protein